MFLCSIFQMGGNPIANQLILGCQGCEAIVPVQVINAVIAPFTLGEKLTSRRTRAFELAKGPHGFKGNMFGRGIPLKST